MRRFSLHPLDPAIVSAYVAALQGGSIETAWRAWFDERLRSDLESVQHGDELAANRITLGLAKALGAAHPVWVNDPLGLTFWEAQIDRPLGMLMRPPARILQEEGIDQSRLLAMPIRLDRRMGFMGGAWIPPRLMDQAMSTLDEHLERCVHRLIAAEYDPMPIIGLTHEAMTYALRRGFGLYEAVDAVGAAGEGVPPIAVMLADRQRVDMDVRQRIELASQPAKKSGLLNRLFGRRPKPAHPNNHNSHNT